MSGAIFWEKTFLLLLCFNFIFSGISSGSFLDIGGKIWTLVFKTQVFVHTGSFRGKLFFFWKNSRLWKIFSVFERKIVRLLAKKIFNSIIFKTFYVSSGAVWGFSWKFLSYFSTIAGFGVFWVVAKSSSHSSKKTNWWKFFSGKLSDTKTFLQSERKVSDYVQKNTDWLVKTAF